MFDEAFLATRLKKQKQWKKKGIKSGSGRPFENTINAFGGGLSLQSDLTKAPKGLDGGDMAAEFTVSDLIPLTYKDGCPDWLKKLVANDGKMRAAYLSKKTVKLESPHAAALVALAKDPSKLARNQEHYIQVRLFYCVEREYPAFYEVMKAVPNGGLRSPKTAISLKAEGQKAGEPDIEVMEPRGRYCGLFLEVKTETGTLQANQTAAIARYNNRGYFATHGKGFDECWKRLTSYFALPDFDFKTGITDNINNDDKTNE